MNTNLFRHTVLVSLMSAAMLALTATPVLAQDAIRRGDRLTGKLRLVRTNHPNGTAIVAFQIVSVPRAMPADDFCDGPARTFHIVAMDHAKTTQLRALLGKTVSLGTDDLFCSHTAWHIGDAVVMRWSALTRR